MGRKVGYFTNKATGSLHIVHAGNGQDITQNELMAALCDDAFFNKYINEEVKKPIDESKLESLTNLLSNHYGFRIGDIDECPSENGQHDRTFRNAWKDESASVSVDMPKARIIHMDKLRIIRNEKLKKLDTDYIRADETKNTEEKQRISALKQQLRDMPQNENLEEIATPEELKRFMPSYLE